MDWHQLRAHTRFLAQHIVLADVFERLGKNPREALEDELHPQRVLLDLNKRDLANCGIRKTDFQFDVEVVAFWLLVNICDQYEPTICSPSGHLLKAPEPLFFHPDQFFYFFLDFPLREMAELATIYQEYDAKRMNGSDFWDRFCCIDADSGLVTHKNQTIRHLINFYEGGEALEQGTSEIFEKHVKPFLGWSIVLDPSNLPETNGQLLKDLLLGESYWYDGDDSKVQERMKKRGPKPSGAKSEFLLRYPEGIPEGLSAEAVAAELTEAGFSIGRRQVSYYDREVRRWK
ncbi:hypothetical protein [Silicimonas sp. MF1-12-2]|uniref:hypothetical protein n=1 Tax=Silicimonas sp. MF1-12-2 TaxID=3384793 RepID=UPI0039B5AA2C